MGNFDQNQWENHIPEDLEAADPNNRVNDKRHLSIFSLDVTGMRHLRNLEDHFP